MISLGPEIGSTSIDETTNMSKKASDVWSLLDVSIKRSRKVRGGNYVQLATADNKGNPACRTVVFRGFLDVGTAERGTEMAMKMITDARSEKVKHAAHNPAAELVWWFSKSSEQYRVAGKLVFVGNSKSDPAAGALTRLPAEVQTRLRNARQQQWANLRDTGREQFYWKQPGVSYSGSPDVPSGGRREEDGKVLPPPDNFLLMLLVPNKVKYLRLTDNFAQESVRVADSSGSISWINSHVNP